MYFAATFLASLLVSANALATPHAGQGMLRRHQHAALAKVRAAAPEPVSQPLEASLAVPKRRLRKRCQPRNTTIAASAASSSAAPASFTAPNPVNVAPSPTASPSSAPPPPPAPSSQAAPPPPAPSSQAPPPPPAASPSPSPSPSQAPPSNGGGTSSGSLFEGKQSAADLTFYSTGLGACGITNNDSDMIAAVSETLFDSFPGYNHVNPNTNPVCNKKVLITTSQNQQITVAITDRCTGCKPTDLDLSPTAFNLLADPSVGRITGASWAWQ